MLDHEHDVRLYGISGRGFELAERYQDVSELEDLSDPVRATLAQIARERTALMERFRRVVVEEGGLPKAGNPEREWLETLVDRCYSTLSGSESMLKRLALADQEWREEIERVSATDHWPAPLTEALADLRAHIDESARRLQQLKKSA